MARQVLTQVNCLVFTWQAGFSLLVLLLTAIVPAARLAVVACCCCCWSASFEATVLASFLATSWVRPGNRITERHSRKLAARYWDACEPNPQQLEVSIGR